MKVEKQLKKEYLPVELLLIYFAQEDIVKTSYAGDNNVGWDDEDASPTGMIKG